MSLLTGVGVKCITGLPHKYASLMPPSLFLVKGLIYGDHSSLSLSLSLSLPVHSSSKNIAYCITLIMIGYVIINGNRQH